MKFDRFTCALLGALALHACVNPKSPDSGSPPERLPMTTVSLTDKSSFAEAGDNWKVVSNVFADYQQEGIQTEPGKGVLVNTPDAAGTTTPLTLDFEHGDLELEMEFLLQKGSNSGVLLQGRYEVDLNDSWNYPDSTAVFCGTILAPSANEAHESLTAISPAVNPCKAPGLWQQLKVFFRAPRFDEQGNKIDNARFESVYLNGLLIHRNVEVNGPSTTALLSGEKPLGPLMIQADGGPVAIRNLNYKSYTLDSLKLDSIQYTLYESNSYKFPDFDTLKVVRTGTATDLNVGEAAAKGEFYALSYDATLVVPVSGEYLFTCSIDEGGEIYIDDKVIIREGLVEGKKNSRALVNLTAGEHKFHVKFFQSIWSASIALYYEGPGISYKRLGFTPRFSGFPRGIRRQPQITVLAETQPEMLRGFLTYRDTVKTHALSVGSPANVHYAFDMNDAALVKGWKGSFADASAMWIQRGESQLLQPMNFSIEPLDGLPMAFLENEKAAWNPDRTLYKFIKYIINPEGYPVYHYKYKDALFEDTILPADDGLGLVRTVSVTGTTDQPMWYRIAGGGPITRLPNGLYSVGGDYYLKLLTDTGVQVRNDDVIVPVLSDAQGSTIQYEIIW